MGAAAAAARGPEPVPLAVGCALAQRGDFPAGATLRLLMFLRPAAAAALTATATATDTRSIELLWGYYSARGLGGGNGGGVRVPRSVAPRAYDRWAYHRVPFVVAIADDALVLGRCCADEVPSLVPLSRSEAGGANALGEAIAAAVPRGANLAVVVDPFILLRVARVLDGSAAKKRRSLPTTEAARRAERARVAASIVTARRALHRAIALAAAPTSLTMGCAACSAASPLESALVVNIGGSMSWAMPVVNGRVPPASFHAAAAAEAAGARLAAGGADAPTRAAALAALEDDARRRRAHQQVLLMSVGGAVPTEVVLLDFGRGGQGRGGSGAVWSAGRDWEAAAQRLAQDVGARAVENEIMRCRTLSRSDAKLALRGTGYVRALPLTTTPLSPDELALCEYPFTLPPLARASSKKGEEAVGSAHGEGAVDVGSKSVEPTGPPQPSRRVVLEAERFLAPELLFADREAAEGGTSGETNVGLAKLAANAMASLSGDDAAQKAVASAVVLSGELAFIGGLAARLARELRPPRARRGRGRGGGRGQLSGGQGGGAACGGVLLKKTRTERWRESVEVLPVYTNAMDEAELLDRKEKIDAAWMGAKTSLLRGELLCGAWRCVWGTRVSGGGGALQEETAGEVEEEGEWRAA